MGRLWLEGDRYDVQPRPQPDRWLRIDKDAVVEEPPDPQQRTLSRRRTGNPIGRPRIHPEGEHRPHRPRITFTPEPDEPEAIQCIAEQHGLAPAVVAAQLIAQALHGTPPSWGK